MNPEHAMMGGMCMLGCGKEVEPLIERHFAIFPIQRAVSRWVRLRRVASSDPDFMLAILADGPGGAAHRGGRAADVDGMRGFELFGLPAQIIDYVVRDQIQPSSRGGGPARRRAGDHARIDSA
jgi:hypothetical protein